MAERRMLSRKITEHDNFTSLPATAQALYVHLVMEADDDGFCDRTNIAISNAHAKKKDLDLLVEMRYLIKFPAGIYAIKHWGVQNAVRKDRYTPTEYQEEFLQLSVKSNGAYSMPGRQPPDNHPVCKPEPERQPLGGHDGAQMATERQPPDNHPQPQVRLGKVRLGKDSNESSVCNARGREEADPPDPDRWDEFWDAYPRKSGGDIREACMEYIAVIDHGVDPEILISAAKGLAKRTTRETFRYLPSAEKWLRNKGWLENPEAAQGSETNNIFLQMYEDEYGGDSQ